MSQIFISYARSTAAEARKIAETLRGIGYGVWWDEELPAHRDYSDVIEERLRAAKAVVVLWSNEAVKSQWVRAEADLAREAGTLVQLGLDGAPLPMPFNRIQCADLRGWTGDPDQPEWRRVVASLDALMDRPEKPAPVIAVESRPDPLLAVLAFDNLSGDPQMAYLSDGVSEEILDSVARGSSLRVIARSSSFQLRGGDKTAHSVAARLRATHLLDGSVRRAGERVRITAQLVECATAVTTWSSRLEGNLEDVFALQDQIAKAVVDALNATFAPPPPVGRIEPAMLELYLKAKNQGLGTANIGIKLDERVRLLEQVTAAEPLFASGWATLGQMRAMLAIGADGSSAFRRLRAEAFQAVEKAIALDPRLPTPYIALNLLEPQGAYAQRWRHVSKALEVAPDHPDALALASHFAFTVGWAGEALTRGRRAYELAPLHPMTAQGYASAVWCSGDSAGAQRLLLGFREANRENAGLNFTLLLIAIITRRWTDFQEAEQFARAHGHFRDPVVRGAIAFGRALKDGDQVFVNRLVQTVDEEIRRTGTAPLHLLNVLCEFGRQDEVFAAVARASFAQIFDGSGGQAAGSYNPGIMFNRSSNWPMMADPRFVGLCHKLGYVDFWLQSGRWPDCADFTPYDFRAEAKRLADVQRPASG